MVRELTYKQKAFCNNIVSGMGARDSYISAYDCKSKSAASIEATKLLKRDDITQYINALNKPIQNAFENEAINARQEQIKAIQERIAICKEKEDENSLIRYYDMLNKIYALYKETETEKKTESTVNNLDMDTLIKLSGVS